MALLNDVIELVETREISRYVWRIRS
jgi:hypothetical protein